MKEKDSKLTVIDNSSKVPVSVREASALALCLNVLEECKNQYQNRVVCSPTGEIITMNSAVEVFDSVMLDKIKTGSDD